MLFSDDHKVRLVGQQREHDKVGVCPVKAVARVRVIALVRLGLSNIVHHLVLALAWHRRIRENYIQLKYVRSSYFLTY